MQNYIFLALGLLGMVLLVAAIYAMSRGGHRKFPGLFFYLLILFLTGVADMAAFQLSGDWQEWYVKYYYVNDIIRQFSGFVAVISLIYTATAQQPRRAALRVKIIGGTALVVLLSFLLTEYAGLGLYMTRVSRNLSFTAVILNVILWFSLIKVRARDRRLFLASGGLGLNMAGEAIAQSLRDLAPSTVFAGNLIAVGSQLLSLWIWWVAFRGSEQQADLPDSIASR